MYKDRFLRLIILCCLTLGVLSQCVLLYLANVLDSLVVSSCHHQNGYPIRQKIVKIIMSLSEGGFNID